VSTAVSYHISLACCQLDEVCVCLFAAPTSWELLMSPGQIPAYKRHCEVFNTGGLRPLHTCVSPRV
jgi:hypothetical protein